MDDHEIMFFDMAIVSILSFQFHPANHVLELEGTALEEVIEKAVSVAAYALKMRNQLIKDQSWLGSQQEPPFSAA